MWLSQPLFLIKKVRTMQTATGASLRVIHLGVPWAPMSLSGGQLQVIQPAQIRGVHDLSGQACVST